ncbi:snRNA-activating protein complex subunit 5-like [Dendronephthya gigantea]|uniref:snRNA-activating protein complex subunit 5-like n=1 Tax=Dendronephthya gigantea TaxID=151771 RepID=UPI00106C67B2|nr:snRNA-activating protein complex subunit 5-like [Dendronephthya gigantea]
MSDYQYTSKEELEKEEVLLKSIKDRLVDQLQRLKVEELALLSNPSNVSQTANSTGSYFSKTTIEGDTNAYEVNEEINCLPLIDLTDSASNTLILSSQPGVNEEEEEEDET